MISKKCPRNPLYLLLTFSFLSALSRLSENCFLYVRGQGYVNYEKVIVFERIIFLCFGNINIAISYLKCNNC